MFIKDIRKDFYEALIGQRILVLVNYDVDAVCAAKLLSTLFKYDNILFSIVPVADAEDLCKAYNSHRHSIKYILLINIGATFDIIELLEPEEEQVFFIADHHRPIDVYNVYRGEQVMLLMKKSDSGPIPQYEELFRENEDEDESEAPVGGRSIEELEKRQELRAWKEQRREKLFTYSQYSYYGESVAWLFFKLAWKMSKDSTELLWLPIVAIYDLYNSNRIEPGVFEDYLGQLKSHVKRISSLKSNVNPFNEESPRIDEILKAPVGRRSYITITQRKDLQLLLYRHWTLYESLRHTMYTCCKFKVWHLKGHKRLLEFLAELGIPLRQCKQKFSSMDFELRQHVQEWMEDLIEKYGLDKLIAESFEASHGFKHKFTASDVACSVKALLESPSKELSLKEKFNKALDSLSWTNVDILHEGIELSKLQYVAILRQVHDIIEMKYVDANGPFLRTVIAEGNPDAKLFSFPGCLITLAQFILEAFVATSRRERMGKMPLVVVCPDINNPGLGLAVGIPPLAEESTQNFFGKAFIQAGQMMNCQIEPSLYDLSVVRFPLEETSNLFTALRELLTPDEKPAPK